MTTLGRRLLATGLIGLMAGCAVPQLPEPAEDRPAAVAAYQDRAARLAELSGWQLDGRVVAKGSGENGQARIRWSRTGAQGRLAVRNPFGQTVLEVRDGPQGLQLRDARGGVYYGSRVHAVLRERLGWRVPLGRLADWALGLARSGEVPPDLDGRGRPRHLTADGWRVAFTEYQQVDGLWLPQAMRVVRDGMELRIRVDRWQLDWSGGNDEGRSA